MRTASAFRDHRRNLLSPRNVHFLPILCTPLQVAERRLPWSNRTASMVFVIAAL